jgi:cytochrome c oxidase subunit II
MVPRTLARSLLGLAVVTATLAVFAIAAPAARFSSRASHDVKEFTIVAARYSFTPDHIEVQLGDRVRITVRSADGTHGFAVKKLNVETEVPRGGEPVTLEFVADRPGVFTISCSHYCGLGHSHMRAELVVNQGERQ